VALEEMAVLAGQISEERLVYIPKGEVFELTVLEEHMENHRVSSFITIMEIYQKILKQFVVIFNGFEDVLAAVSDLHIADYILSDFLILIE